MTDIMTIPLNRLTPWKGNVRKTGSSDGIDELAASLAAHGQLQSLVIREGKRGKYEILAGRRRYLAMLQLAKTGQIAKDHPVQCTLAQASVNATELSLVENTVRAPMHPADQFEAFRDLIDAGASITDLAARFGVADSLVVKLLKLGRLSPAVLDAYRNDEIDLEQAQAFAISDDHAAQERVLESSPHWGLAAHAIRRALTQDEVPTSDKRVRFVGLDAYRAAGGAIRQDLFSEEDSGFVADPDLLDTLVADKLSQAADAVKAEGWKWVEGVVDRDGEMLSGFALRSPDRVELSDADQSEYDRLTKAYDDLLGSEEDADQEQLDGLQAQIDVLASRMEIWSEETLEKCGAVLSLDHSGGLRIDRGYLLKSDVKKRKAETSSDSDQADCPSASISASLMTDLSAQRTAALAVELGRRPDIALAAVVHAFLIDRYPCCDRCSSLSLSFRAPALAMAIKDADASRPLAALNKQIETLQKSLPQDEDALWPFCLSRTQEELVAMLAILAGSSVDAMTSKGHSSSRGGQHHTDQLAEALELDMTAWFTPTAESYFSRVNRSQILAAIDEAKGSHAPSLEKLKKADLAARAEAMLADTGWLPEQLRNERCDDSAE